MKSAVLSFAFIAVIVLMIVSVESRSMPNCPSTCNTSLCPTFDCVCGTHKDDCQCCEFCSVCPAQPCSLVRNEQCSEGYTCTYPAQSDHAYQMQNDGLCSPRV
ncbi:transglutaminase substrate [Nephila pilipes]|uniref:Transglutaminase substrate n=1 Tax=Nephila pilipes TaxID=299642 RepID=A0A8X6UPU3_NEPPI|nr:transglutaminase substrate [Nephila pilipes]